MLDTTTNGSQQKNQVGTIVNGAQLKNQNTFSLCLKNLELKIKCYLDHLHTTIRLYLTPITTTTSEHHHHNYHHHQSQPRLQNSNVLLLYFYPHHSLHRLVAHTPFYFLALGLLATHNSGGCFHPAVLYIIACSLS